MVQLRSDAQGGDDNFVTVYWPDGAVRVDSVAYTHASTFEVTTVGNSQWQLRAVKNNNFLSAEGGGGDVIVANRTSASGWETFEVTQLDGGRVQLQTFSGQWITVDGSLSHQLVATGGSSQEGTTFTVIEVPQHRGANLGAWMIPEKWMFSDDSTLWAGTDATDLYSLCTSLGQEEATRRLTEHRDTWFTESDFETMANNGVNHVRLPMAYWDVDPNSSPYTFGGQKYINLALDWAAAHGMTVLIDLHAAPGSQNGQDHSGHSGAINWSDPANVAWTVEVLETMAKLWGNHPAVWGIELLNEPHYSLSHDLLTSFYRDAYNAIRTHSADVHVVICSLYGPHDWTAGVLPEPQYRNVVLDLHLYTVWSGLTQPQQYYDATADWGRQIRELVPFYPIIVGELSLAVGEVDGQAPVDFTQQIADNSFTSFRDNALGYYFWSEKLGYATESWALVDGFHYVKDYYLA